MGGLLPGKRAGRAGLNRIPHGGTEDVTLTGEEGVNYEPPDNPPPPHRKD